MYSATDTNILYVVDSLPAAVQSLDGAAMNECNTNPITKLTLTLLPNPNLKIIK